MSGTHFELEQEFEVEISILHAFLCDLNNYVPLHPLIESIEQLSPSKDRPRARRYRVVDRIPLGPFKLRTAYTAALESIAENEVHGNAWQFPSIRLHTVYSLAATSAGTRLAEKVTVHAPWLIRRYVARQAKVAHVETLSKMKGLLESRSPVARPGHS
jgi:hypothetical protein